MRYIYKEDYYTKNLNKKKTMKIEKLFYLDLYLKRMLDIALQTTLQKIFIVVPVMKWLNFTK